LAAKCFGIWGTWKGEGVMAGVRGQHSGGSNRKTVEEHLRNGTFRRDRHGAIGAPSPTPFVARRGARTPRAPDGLSEASAALWRRFHAEYDLRSAPTLELLESALRCRDVAEAARAALEREGLTFKDAAGKPRPHPAAAIHRDARAQFVSTLRTLGFPSEQS
jgi:phage terminase small subunit